MTPERFSTLFHSALDHLHVGYQVVDFDWHYIYVNPAAAAQGRRTVAELQGKSMLDLYPGIEATAMFRVLERCMNDRVADEFDNLFSYLGGESRWFEIRVEPVAEGICIYSNDIHERKLWQLEMEERARTMGVPLPLTAQQWRSFVSGDFFTES
jgi:PAS domain S-box-containing protein